MALYIVALILGILFTIRKLDVAKRQPEDFPNVDRAAFERWKRLEGSAYGLGSFACFLEIGLDIGLGMLAKRGALDWSIVRATGATLFLLWVIALIVAGVRASRGRRLREELGIDLSARRPEEEGRSGDT